MRQFLQVFQLGWRREHDISQCLPIDLSGAIKHACPEAPSEFFFYVVLFEYLMGKSIGGDDRRAVPRELLGDKALAAGDAAGDSDQWLVNSLFVLLGVVVAHVERSYASPGLFA